MSFPLPTFLLALRFNKFPTTVTLDPTATSGTYNFALLTLLNTNPATATCYIPEESILVAAPFPV
ncbi:hypothetical protein SNOG_20152 [Parastagonospora nodorum SN15]|uniref:Uncharacterized protein n=1 Tax=Phaeosphaeria nodorum (strain SN15 / ATCC MYA-4574 / FGSC 10173) TaxID=321614 RepID=A9JXE8_PHANO|nr:hypothetical protein SNOG_20152 [Parastagonospora nodorum SN15]EDP89838.1 hypothetical protein SNOG_20152 [Parastagonospora nodorum SN15]